jgi:AGCS family alanine or glycine:cation symporter
MAHATVRTNEPMSQGFAALMEPFLDTVVICLLTALVVVVSGVYQTSASEVSRSPRTRSPPSSLVPGGAGRGRHPVCAVDRVSWGYYGEQAWTWLFSERQASRVAYRLFLCSVLSVAATLDIGQVVNIVDSLNFCMAIPNSGRRLSAAAGVAHGSRQLLAARGAAKGEQECRVRPI